MAYPANFPNVLLVNSITVSTTVTLVNGMQVATVTFNTSAGLMGTITLSPVQTTATGLEYKAGKQVLSLSQVTFQAAFGLEQGSVVCVGSATNQQGTDNTSFDKQVATWS